MDLTLSQRSRQILEAIVEDYIVTAEPVGSSAVAKRHAMPLSSATVRNVMSTLEELGLLTSPHTSAGRVPTEKGFRFYVDSLISLRNISHKEKKEILKRYKETGGNLTSVLRETSRTLSSLSNYTGIVVAPRFNSSLFRQIEFIKLGHQKILAIMVSCNGTVQNRILDSSEEYTTDDLVRMGNYLNGILEGLTIGQVRQKLIDEMKSDKSRYDAIMSGALKLSEKALPETEQEIFIAGQSKIISHPEFSDIEKMKEIFEAFEEKGRLLELLGSCMDAQGVQIFIGAETPLKEMAGMSLITSTYMTGNDTIGLLGGIGPTRMGYSTVIPIVDYTAKVVSRLLLTD